MAPHHLLLVFVVPANAGREKIAMLIERMKEHVEFQNFSGLYKRFLNQRREDLNAELMTVAYASTTLTSTDLQAKLKLLISEAKHSDHLVGKVSLLAWNDQVSLLPQLTLPHPSLVDDQLILLCAAEARGEFTHPILRKSLRELLRGVSQSPLAEFVSQAGAFFEVPN